MASILNADTSNGLKITSDTSGELKIQSAGADIATVDSSGIAMAAGKTLPAAALTGTLPALDASSLTNIPAANLTGSLPAGMGGKILQVVSTTKTDTFSTTSGSFTNVTGLAATITPSSTSSKILVLVDVVVGWDNGATKVYGRIARGSTGIGIGTPSGGYVQTGFEAFINETYHAMPANLSYLDSPSTTSATTYNVQIRAQSAGQSVHCNRSHGYRASTTYDGTCASTITVMEIAG